MITDRFSYKVYLPTHKRYIRCFEFTGEQYLTIAKHIQNDDDERVVQLFKKLIRNTCENKQISEKLTKIDMFCVLLNMRILCVSDRLEMMINTSDENQTPQKIVFDLYDILDRVTNYETEYSKNIIVSDHCSVRIDTPTEFIYTNSDDLIQSVIKHIVLFNKKYNFTGLTKNQQKQVLDALPGDLLTKITSQIHHIDKGYSVNVLDRERYKAATENDTFDFSLRMYDGSFYEFLKLIYGCNLEEQYYIRYLMVKQMGFTLNDVATQPPHITNTYINLYRKELDEQKKQAEKNNNTGGGMQLPQQNFTQ